MIPTPAKCREGTCEHKENFPHKIVTAPAETVTIRSGSKTVGTKVHRPAIRFILCATCRHWLSSGASWRCDCCLNGHKGWRT